MATKTTKKTVAAKKPAVKKTTTKKTVKTEKAEIKTVAEKKVVAKKQPVKAAVKKVNTKMKPVAEVKTAAEVKTVQQEKKDFGATPLSHALFVIMTVLLWAFLTAWVIIDLNYEVTIEHKDVVAARITRRMERLQKQKAKKMSSTTKKKGHYTILDNKTGKLIAVVIPVEQKNEVKQMPKRDARPDVKKAVRPAPKKVSRPPLKLAERKAAFIESEYAPYAGTGKAVIEGNACFELADGSTKCFENADVFINPVTTYSDEWYNRGWAGKEFLAKADARALPFNKMIKTGKDGAFKFEGLQPGSYYVGAMVCMPQAADSKRCFCTRFASKVTMKNRVKTTLKQVFPPKPAK